MDCAALSWSWPIWCDTVLIDFRGTRLMYGLWMGQFGILGSEGGGERLGDEKIGSKQVTFDVYQLPECIAADSVLDLMLL